MLHDEVAINVVAIEALVSYFVGLLEAFVVDHDHVKGGGNDGGSYAVQPRDVTNEKDS